MQEVLYDGMDALPSGYGRSDERRRSQVQVLCAGWDDTVFCSEHRKYSGAPWRKYSTLVWGKNEATSRRRFMESLEEALKVRSRVGMHTDVSSA